MRVFLLVALLFASALGQCGFDVNWPSIGTIQLAGSTSSSFTISGNQQVILDVRTAGTLTLSNCGQSSADSQFEVVNENGGVVGYVDDYCGLQTQLTVNLGVGIFRFSIYRYYCSSGITSPVSFTWTQTGGAALSCAVSSNWPALATISGSGVFDLQTGTYSTLSLSGSAQVAISTCGTTLDTEIIVWSVAAGAQVIFNDDSATCGLGSYINLPLVGGTYLIYVFINPCNGNAGTTITTQFDINYVQSPVCGVSSSWPQAAAITGGYSSGSGQIALATGQYAQITLQAPGTLHFDTCGLAGFDSSIQLWHVSLGAMLAYNDDSCGLQSSMDIALPAGTYQLFLYRFYCNNDGSSSNINWNWAPSVVPNNYCPVSPAWSGSGTITPASFGTSSGSFSLSTGSFYNFALNVPGHLTLTNCGQNPADTQFILTDASGNQIFYSDDSCSSLASTIDIDLNPGVYKLFVYQYYCNVNGMTTPVSYTFTSAVVDASCDFWATWPEVNVLSFGNFHSSGQVGVSTSSYSSLYFATSGTIFLDTCNVASFDTMLQVVDGNFVEVAFNDDCCGLQSCVSFAVPAGSYYRVYLWRFYCSADGSSSSLNYYFIPDSYPSSCGNIPSSWGEYASVSIPDAPSSGTFNSVTGTFVTIYVPSTGTLTLSNCGIFGDDSEFMLYSFESGQVAFVDDYCGLQSQITVSGLAMGVYRFYLWRFNCNNNGINSNVNWNFMPDIINAQCPIYTSWPEVYSFSLDAMSTSGSFGFASQQFATFTVSAVGTLTVSTCGQTNDDTSLILVDANAFAQVLYVDDSCGVQTSLSAVLNPGTYRVYLFRYYCNADESSNILYSWTTGPYACPVDPSWGYAGDISLGASASSGTFPMSVATFYSFSLYSAGTLTVNNCAYTTANTQILLVDPNSGTQIAFDDNGCGSLASAISVGLNAGTYYFYLYGAPCLVDGAANSNFDFTWTPLPQTQCPIDTAWGQGPSALSLDSTYQNGQFDAFEGSYATFQANVDGTLHITACGLAGFDTQFLVVDSNGVQVGYNDDSCGLASTLDLALAPGTYRMYLYTFYCGNNGASTSVSYLWTPNHVNAYCGFETTWPVFSSVDMSASSGTFTAQEATVSQLVFTSSGTVTLSNCGLASFDSMFLVFSTNSYTQVAANDDSCGTYQSTITFDFVPGTYNFYLYTYRCNSNVGTQSSVSWSIAGGSSTTGTT